MNDDIKSRYENVQQWIKNACQRAGRKEKSVHLLAVSKGQSVDLIRQLYGLGQRDFGENYIDELLKKKKLLQEECSLIRWHFIGQIQTNKAKKIAGADFVHSVSNEKQAALLAKYRSTEKSLPIFLQVNLEEAEHRGGASLLELKDLYHRIKEIKELQLQGLMVVLPLELEKNPQLAFSKIAEIGKKIEKDEAVLLPELSMGMSNDFGDAILCGSTWIRIGTLLFGPRNN